MKDRFTFAEGCTETTQRWLAEVSICSCGSAGEDERYDSSAAQAAMEKVGMTKGREECLPAGHFQTGAPYKRLFLNVQDAPTVRTVCNDRRGGMEARGATMEKVFFRI
ncbi:hypothetical protein [Chitinophaga rhizosphaerae]|uniref:hypothetical protein n=1 Tax=Chitinophaga rhizosphaerae TaxID=1864947 RepID=UPI000F7FF300|nr:hypothetical protein [Chitinophaga rhizosphaerae]